MVTMNRNKVVIVGTGQVGATAAFGIVTHGLCNELVLIDCSAAKALGAGEIVVISRKGADNYQNLSRHADAEIVVNTTPVGMYPVNGAAPVDLTSRARLHVRTGPGIPG